MSTELLEPALNIDLTLMPRADVPSIYDALRRKAEQLVKTAGGLTVTSPDQKQEMALARTTRLELRAIRIEGDKQHKDLKAGLLIETKKIDGAAKALRDFIEPLEERLLGLEQFAERFEQERYARVLAERTEKLREVNGRTGADIGILSDEEFTQVLADATQLFTLRKQQEEQAELWRQQQAQKEADERERERLENIRLKEESDKAAAEAKAERDRLRADVDADNSRRDAEIAEVQAKLDAAEQREQRTAAPPQFPAHTIKPTPEPVKAAPGLTVTHPASFTKPASRFSLDEKIAVLGRELGMRQRVYPQRVARGEMLQEAATFQTDVLAEILAEYHAQKRAAEPDLLASL